MNILLYTVKPPAGRCLRLAKSLRDVTSLSGSECIQLAMRLFASHHSRETHAVIEVSDARAISDLETTCVEFGIAIELLEMGEEMAHDGRSK